VAVDIETRVIPPHRVDITLEQVFVGWGAGLRDAINAEWPRDTGFSQWKTEADGRDQSVFSEADYAHRVHKRGEAEPFLEVHAPELVAEVAAKTSPGFTEVARNMISIFGDDRGRT